MSQPQPQKPVRTVPAKLGDDAAQPVKIVWPKEVIAAAKLLSFTLVMIWVFCSLAVVIGLLRLAAEGAAR